MQTVTASLEPQRVFYHFEQISRIPHPSGSEEKIGQYLLDFASEHALAASRDDAGNVIIIKEASAGRENEEPLILQGHMDMVCEKDPDCMKDMQNEGLDLALDGDWLYAKGTTLGGDDGIAVAIALALLEDDTLSHPRMEFLCTTQEETGMDGAHGLDPSPLTGHCLLNIDSEEEGILTAGCAGGETLVLRLPVRPEPASGCALTLSVSGLTGGHSGSVIQEGHANADVLMIRILRQINLAHPIRLVSLEGGSKHNAIPRYSRAVILTDDPAGADAEIRKLEKALRAEYRVTDPDLELDVSGSSGDMFSAMMDSPEFPADSLTYTDALTIADTQKVLAMLSAIPDGVQHKDQYHEGLVETSLNLGILRMPVTEVRAEYLVRSSMESRLEEMLQLFTCIAEQAGATLTCQDKYPAWKYVPESVFRDKMVRIFEEQYGKVPVVETIHAGLECGLLSEKIPELDAVSIGPDIENIHTSQERMSVSSVERTYKYIRQIIETP